MRRSFYVVPNDDDAITTSAARGTWYADTEAALPAYVRRYKLWGPSPKPFKRRPWVDLDGHAIEAVEPADGGGSIIYLITGGKIHVTAFAATVQRHMVDVANADATRAPETKEADGGT